MFKDHDVMASSSDDEENDPALDFLSVTFDPSKVLQTSPSRLELPHPSVQPCDNLQAYTSVVQGKRQDPRPRTPVQPHPQSPPKEQAQRPKPKKKIKTVLDFMQRSNTGPFSLLQTCLRTGRPVRVSIRHCAGVRGVCEGVCVLYDRHLNLVLRHVTEWYSPFRTLGNGGITLTKQQRRKKRIREKQQTIATEPGATGIVPGDADKGEPGCSTVSGSMTKWECSRTVKQLFIRGDSVIYVSPVHQVNPVT